MKSTIDMMLDGATRTPIDNACGENELFATHSGVLNISGIEIKCWRLSDGRAMIDADSMARLVGFDSSAELANDLERLGNTELAAKVRAPTTFNAEK